MTTPEIPAAAPLDAEREALRKVGHTEAEISQILVARTLAGAQQPAGAAGQGVMSNVLSSIVAVASHARVLIPTFRKDVETVFNSTATASVRAGATASLAVKAIVVIVLGFAAWQEWKQHIIYSTEIAESQARKLKAEADAASGRVIRLCEIDHTCPEDAHAPIARDNAPLSADEETRMDALKKKCGQVIGCYSKLTADESREYYGLVRRWLRAHGIEDHSEADDVCTLPPADCELLKRMRKDPVAPVER
jgi:hypothetical protein